MWGLGGVDEVENDYKKKKFSTFNICKRKVDRKNHFIKVKYKFEKLKCTFYIVMLVIFYKVHFFIYLFY